MESRFTAECASANAGLITLDSKPSERIDFNLDEYIAGLKWSDQATDHEKTLVIGNLRAMFAVIRERHNALARMALELSNAVVSSTQTEELSSSPTATPRTDAVVRDMVKNRPWWADDRLMKHARQLERELAAAHRRAECFKEAMHSYEKAARVEMASVQSPRGRYEDAMKALRTLQGYNQDIRDGKINYRPDDHLEIIKLGLEGWDAPTPQLNEGQK